MDDDGASILSDISFSEDDIVKACGELKASSAAGADSVPAALIKNCRNETPTLPSLALIFG